MSILIPIFSLDILFYLCLWLQLSCIHFRLPSTLLYFISYLLLSMKKLLQLWVLSIALIVCLLLLNDRTNAASGAISLRIYTGTSSCVYGTSLYLGQHTGSYVAFSLTGTFTPTIFSCTDFEGMDAWSMTLFASGDLSNWLQTISKNNVSLKVDANMVTSWLCVTGQNTTTFTSIGSIPWVILAKTSHTWDICTISASNVQLVVYVPENQAVGTYIWNLILLAPWN